jgi:ubiquinone/menaquinone biosynthesis C-methylase UbiE
MNEIVQKFYDDNAVIYDQEQEEFAFVRGPEWKKALDVIRDAVKKTDSVLEIGAGTGRFTLETAPLVKQVTAVDISLNMLGAMSEKMKQKGIVNVRQICGSFMDIELTEKYDVIMSFSAIEYIKDPKGLFAKISGLLAPGGRLILTTAHNTFFRFWGRLGNYFRQGIFMEAYSKRKVKRFLKAGGIQVVELTDMCMKVPPFKGILLFVYAEKR